jgi:hypothetical protein
MLWYLMRMWTIFGWQRYTPYWFICILVFVEIKLFVMQFYLLKSLSFLKIKISIIQNLLYTDMTIKLQSVAIQIPDWVIFQSLALVRTAICWQRTLCIEIQIWMTRSIIYRVFGREGRLSLLCFELKIGGYMGIKKSSGMDMATKLYNSRKASPLQERYILFREYIYSRIIKISSPKIGKNV